MQAAIYVFLLEWFKAHGFRTPRCIGALRGYGSHSRIHSVGIFRLSEDLPIIVGVVDDEDKIRRSLEEPLSYVKEGLVTIKPVEIIYYGHDDRHSQA